MKKPILFGVLAVLLVQGAAYAAMDGLGLGIIAGEPTGLSMKTWISDSAAVDGALAWSFADGESFQVHADYLRHVFNVTKEFEGRLPLYYGVGARVQFKEGDRGDDETRFGVRIPLGMSYLFQKEPIDLFLEVVPILDLVRETSMRLNAAVGVRYYLN